MNRYYLHIWLKSVIRSLLIITLVLFVLNACNKDEASVNQNQSSVNQDDTSPVLTIDNTLPPRSGPRPKTTEGIPHIQIDVQLVPDVHQEMVRKIYAIRGIEDRPSAIASWRGMLISEDFSIQFPQALISGREFGHIHDDGSLHIFLEPKRAREAVETGWAVFHPFALSGDKDWKGFVMLYTPQSLEELDITFLLIQEAFVYVTGS